MGLHGYSPHTHISYVLERKRTGPYYFKLFIRRSIFISWAQMGGMQIIFPFLPSFSFIMHSKSILNKN